MRKKIKQILNKEEGFTLVELLAVIVILGIIVAIAIPTIGNVTGRAENTAKEAEKELAIDAAQLYVVENGVPTATDGDGVITTDEGKTTQVPVAFLVDKGYLEEPSEKMENAKVEITSSEPTKDGNINYTYKVTGASE